MELLTNALVEITNEFNKIKYIKMKYTISKFGYRFNSIKVLSENIDNGTLEVELNENKVINIAKVGYLNIIRDIREGYLKIT